MRESHVEATSRHRKDLDSTSTSSKCAVTIKTCDTLLTPQHESIRRRQRMQLIDSSDSRGDGEDA